MRLYFAYGSNMDRGAMRRRCPDARPVGPAVLQGYRFFVGRQGWGSVRPWPGNSVHGVLWQISPRDMVALHTYELLHKGLYDVRTLPVRHNGRHVSALIYILRRRATGRARPAYIGGIVAAARSWHLPQRYVASLERLAA